MKIIHFTIVGRTPKRCSWRTWLVLWRSDTQDCAGASQKQNGRIDAFTDTRQDKANLFHPSTIFDNPSTKLNQLLYIIAVIYPACVYAI